MHPAPRIVPAQQGAGAAVVPSGSDKGETMEALSETLDMQRVVVMRHGEERASPREIDPAGCPLWGGLLCSSFAQAALGPAWAGKRQTWSLAARVLLHSLTAGRRGLQANGMTATSRSGRTPRRIRGTRR